MGWGDELIAAGQARLARAQDPRKVRVLDANGKPRFHEAWQGNPHIAHPAERGDFQSVVNGPSARPYIAAKHQDRWVWRRFQCTPADLVINRYELAVASRLAVPGAVVVEPNLKHKASPNKDWGWERWCAFAELAKMHGIDLVQLGATDRRLLPGARLVQTPTLRLACAVLATSAGYVGHEGGLHHSAAAMGRPAVVIFGGFISPEQTGYATHMNLFTGGKPCGSRMPCPHCAIAMAAIAPEVVIARTEEMLVQTPGHLAA